MSNKHFKLCAAKVKQRSNHKNTNSHSLVYFNKQDRCFEPKEYETTPTFQQNK
eukprot:m.379397 g.379397  ORF g.379397 m.379397 type:complete len:53 (+) comp98182_c0_seq1:68-226(+)